MLFRSGEFHDYIAAEQAVMAIDLLLSQAGNRESEAEWLDKVYESVADEDNFDPYLFSDQFTSR